MRYRVVETAQFSELWDAATDAGVIDAVADNLLQSLARFLSLDPYCFPLFENAEPGIALRRLDFVHGASVKTEIWYSVVEDDLTVYLESIEVIRPPQGFLPGFDP